LELLNSNLRLRNFSIDRKALQSFGVLFGFGPCEVRDLLAGGVRQSAKLFRLESRQLKRAVTDNEISNSCCSDALLTQIQG